jgi:hypothetical protein
VRRDTALRVGRLFALSPIVTARSFALDGSFGDPGSDDGVRLLTGQYAMPGDGRDPCTDDVDRVSYRRRGVGFFGLVLKRALRRLTVSDASSFATIAAGRAGRQYLSFAQAQPLVERVIRGRGGCVGWGDVNPAEL